MNPALWGLASALSWGSADFVARISGRAIGPVSSLLGMTIAGLVFLTVWLAVVGTSVPSTLAGVPWLIVSGVGTTGSMLLLYAALNRGLVAVAAPLVGSFPVFVVLGSVVLGIVPTVPQWIAMVAVLVGCWLVTTSEPAATTGGKAEGLGVTIVYSLISAVSFAIALFAAREAIPQYGYVESVWAARVVGLAALAIFIPVTRTRVALPARWWPAIAIQGALDTTGIATIFIGAVGSGAPLAAVGSAPVAVVTVVLTAMFLKEPVPLKRWAGIALVAAAGGALAYYSHQGSN